MDSEQSSLIKYQIILIFLDLWKGGFILFFIIEYSVHTLADDEI